MQAYATPHHMTAASKERRRVASGMFDAAFTTLDQAMCDAEKMVKDMEKEGLLMQAPPLFPDNNTNHFFSK